MEEFAKHMEINTPKMQNHTPLPSHLHGKSFSKKLFFFTLIPFIFFGLAVSAYIYFGRNFVENGLAGGSRAPNNENLAPTLTITSEATPTPTTGIVPPDWLRKKSSSCAVTIAIPPAVEPYIIPRDPNTKPSATDDEGRLWAYEDLDADLFMFNRMARAIFKDPQEPGSVYISAAVEVYCMSNQLGLTTDQLEEELVKNLSGNFSVVKIRESIDDESWGYPAKLIRFSGGSFGDERYILLAREKTAYLIRSYGESSNKDVVDTRNFILNSIEFEN